MKPSKKQLGFAPAIIILIIAVVIVAGGTGYCFYKSSQEQKESEVEIVGPEQVLDETVGWETYRNEEYGFEVRYPKEKDWRVMEIKPTDQDWESEILIASSQYKFALEIFDISRRTR